MNEQLVEDFNLQGVAVRVNRDAGIIHGVKILGLESKNGRVYRPAVLERAVPLYEGARVNVNHPAQTQAPRGYEDRIGAVRNVHARGDGLYGDFFFNPKHRLAEQLVWDAEHAPENVGFSHNVLARTSRQGEKTLVEEIVRVQSVDLVADPATTQGLFESAASARFAASAWDNATQRWVPITRGADSSASVDAAGDDHLEASHRLLLLEAENRRLRDECEQARSEAAQLKRQMAIEATIAAAQLPAELNTAVFREQCLATADDESLRRLIEARQQDARLLRSGRPQSIEQQRASLPELPLDAAQFAAALR